MALWDTCDTQHSYTFTSTTHASVGGGGADTMVQQPQSFDSTFVGGGGGGGGFTAKDNPSPFGNMPHGESRVFHCSSRMIDVLLYRRVHAAGSTKQSPPGALALLPRGHGERR